MCLNSIRSVDDGDDPQRRAVLCGEDPSRRSGLGTAAPGQMFASFVSVFMSILDIYKKYVVSLDNKKNWGSSQ